MDVLKFIFSAHLELFNTRREHEWRVIISALVLIGAVDVTMLSQHMKLTDRQEDFWWFALLVLLLSIGWYQWGVQKRNRADRIAMDRVLHVLCDDIKVAPDSCIRAGVDREDPRVLTTQSDIIFHFTYLWAFLAQMSVLIVATALSMYLPVLIKELATSAGSPPAAQVFGMISDKLVGLAR
jgi:hypothetical protein